MKIRDGHGRFFDKKTEYEITSDALEIIADDGRPLFRIQLEDNGEIEIGAIWVCKHGENLLCDRIEIHPRACNRVVIRRPIDIY